MLEVLYGGVAPPGGLPPPLAPGWKSSKAVDPSTEGFLRLYHHVTDGIDQHAWARRWQPFEALFFDCAVAGFFDEYQKWPTAPIADYLTLFRKTRYRALQVVAHAYLHVAYDLPRVLVQDLDAADRMQQALATRFPPTTASIGTVIGRFLDLQDVMRESLERAGRDAEIFGTPAYLLRLMPGRSHFLDVFGNWVLVLRSNSLLYAQIVAEKPVALRTSDNVRFRQIYKAAADVAKNHPKNPIAWFGGFKTWFGAVTLPLAILAQLEPVTIAAPLQVTAVLSLLTVAAVGVGAIWMLDAWLASYADQLGRAIQTALTRPGTDTDDRQDQEPRGTVA